MVSLDLTLPNQSGFLGVTGRGVVLFNHFAELNFKFLDLFFANLSIFPYSL